MNSTKGDNTPTNTLREELEKWLEGRPQIVKDISRKYPPWKTYVHKGHPDTATYTLHSVSEDGTVTCNKVDFVGIPIQVFGMNPEDLVELETPNQVEDCKE